MCVIWSGESTTDVYGVKKRSEVQAVDGYMESGTQEVKGIQDYVRGRTLSGSRGGCAHTRSQAQPPKRSRSIWASFPALMYSAAKNAFEPPSQPNESSLSSPSAVSMSAAPGTAASTGEPASDSSFSARKSNVASSGEGVSGSSDDNEDGNVDDGDKDGVRTSFGGELRRLARLVGDSDGSSSVKLRDVGEADAHRNGDIGGSPRGGDPTSTPPTGSSSSLMRESTAALGNAGPSVSKPNPSPTVPPPLLLPKEGALTGLVSVLTRFFFGLRLVGLGNTPTAGELNALPNAQSRTADVVSTVKFRRLRRSTEVEGPAAELDADAEEEDKKLNGCGRFLLDDEGGGVSRLLSDILRVGFLSGEAPSVNPPFFDEALW